MEIIKWLAPEDTSSVKRKVGLIEQLTALEHDVATYALKRILYKFVGDIADNLVEHVALSDKVGHYGCYRYDTTYALIYYFDTSNYVNLSDVFTININNFLELYFLENNITVKCSQTVKIANNFNDYDGSCKADITNTYKVSVAGLILD